MSHDPDTPSPLTVVDDDNPEWTEADFARARPAHEVLAPDVLSAFPLTRASRGPQRMPTKVAVQIRLSRDVVERFKADGPGWQTRMDEALRRAAGL